MMDGAATAAATAADGEQPNEHMNMNGGGEEEDFGSLDDASGSFEDAAPAPSTDSAKEEEEGGGAPPAPPNETAEEEEGAVELVAEGDAGQPSPIAMEGKTSEGLAVEVGDRDDEPAQANGTHHETEQAVATTAASSSGSIPVVADTTLPPPPTLADSSNLGNGDSAGYDDPFASLADAGSGGGDAPLPDLLGFGTPAPASTASASPPAPAPPPSLDHLTSFVTAQESMEDAPSEPISPEDAAAAETGEEEGDDQPEVAEEDDEEDSIAELKQEEKMEMEMEEEEEEAEPAPSEDDAPVAHPDVLHGENDGGDDFGDFAEPKQDAADAEEALLPVDKNGMNGHHSADAEMEESSEAEAEAAALPSPPEPAVHEEEPAEAPASPAEEAVPDGGAETEGADDFGSFGEAQQVPPVETPQPTNDGPDVDGFDAFAAAPAVPATQESETVAPAEAEAEEALEQPDPPKVGDDKTNEDGGFDAFASATPVEPESEPKPEPPAVAEGSGGFDAFASEAPVEPESEPTLESDDGDDDGFDAFAAAQAPPETQAQESEMSTDAGPLEPPLAEDAFDAFAGSAPVQESERVIDAEPKEEESKDEEGFDAFAAAATVQETEEPTQSETPEDDEEGFDAFAAAAPVQETEEPTQSETPEDDEEGFDAFAAAATVQETEEPTESETPEDDEDGFDAFAAAAPVQETEEPTQSETPEDDEDGFDAFAAAAPAQETEEPTQSETPEDDEEGFDAFAEAAPVQETEEPTESETPEDDEDGFDAFAEAAPAQESEEPMKSQNPEDDEDGFDAFAVAAPSKDSETPTDQADAFPEAPPIVDGPVQPEPKSIGNDVQAVPTEDSDDFGDFGAFEDAGDQHQAISEPTETQASISEDVNDPHEDSGFGAFGERIGENGNAEDKFDAFASAESQQFNDNEIIDEKKSGDSLEIPSNVPPPSTGKNQAGQDDDEDEDEDDFGDFGDFEGDQGQGSGTVEAQQAPAQSEGVTFTASFESPAANEPTPNASATVFPPADPVIERASVTFKKVFARYARDHADEPKEETLTFTSIPIKSILESVTAIESPDDLPDAATASVAAKERLEKVLADIDVEPGPPTLIMNFDHPKPYAHYSRNFGESVQTDRGLSLRESSEHRSDVFVPEVLSIDLPKDEEEKPKEHVVEKRNSSEFVDFPATATRVKIPEKKIETESEPPAMSTVDKFLAKIPDLSFMLSSELSLPTK